MLSDITKEGIICYFNAEKSMLKAKIENFR